jgi:hypothetical protein
MATSINLSQIELSIKRRLSEAEISAIEKIGEHLPAERRQRKRLLRQARERARKAELAARKRAGLLGEPTEEELRAAMNALSTWQTSAGFVAAVQAIGNRVPTEKLWGNRYKRLREAMTLAEVCKHDATIVAARMGDDPPDAFVRFADGKDQEAEITEVLEPGRKRGDEYRRGGAALSTFLPKAERIPRAEEIIRQLEKAVESKSGKYGFKPNLLIYLNFPHHEETQALIQAGIENLRSKYADEFRQIYVVTDRKLL